MQLTVCRPPTMQRLLELLQDADQKGQPFGLVHFDGHGLRPHGEGEAVVMLETPAGDGQLAWTILHNRQADQARGSEDLAHQLRIRIDVSALPPASDADEVIAVVAEEAARLVDETTHT